MCFCCGLQVGDCVMPSRLRRSLCVMAPPLQPLVRAAVAQHFSAFARPSAQQLFHLHAPLAPLSSSLSARMTDAGSGIGTPQSTVPPWLQRTAQQQQQQQQQPQRTAPPQTRQENQREGRSTEVGVLRSSSAWPAMLPSALPCLRCHAACAHVLALAAAMLKGTCLRAGVAVSLMRLRSTGCAAIGSKTGSDRKQMEIEGVEAVVEKGSGDGTSLPAPAAELLPSLLSLHTPSINLDEFTPLLSLFHRPLCLCLKYVCNVESGLDVRLCFGRSVCHTRPETRSSFLMCCTHWLPDLLFSLHHSSSEIYR